MKTKAVIIGFSHMHVNEVALYIHERPDMELCAVAAVPSKAEPVAPFRYTHDWNLRNVRENYCPEVYGDYRIMLDTVKPDIAFILTENGQKPEVVEECAKRGVDVSIEKPMAVSLEEAGRIEKAVKDGGIRAVVNWPVVWREYVLKMKAALDAGLVGRPLKLRYINGHTGPLGKGAKHRGVSENAEEMQDADRAKTWWHKSALGGGVWLDIACYGCFFSRWFLGADAKSVVAMGGNLNTPFGDTDDNFAAAIRYEKAMAVIEGTWTTPRAVIPSGPMVLGTEGVILCTGGAENAPDVKAYDLYGNELPIPEYTLEEKYKNMPCHLMSGEGIHEMLTLENNLQVMALLDAAMRSAESGREEPVHG